MTTAPQVFAAVAAAFGVPEGFHSTPVRTLALAYARFAAWKILRDSDSMMTLCRLGELSHRDHGSIMHGLTRANDLMVTDEQFRERFNDAMTALKITTICT